MSEYKTYMVPLTEEEAEQNKGAELLIRCKDCKYQPNSKRRYADNDPIAFYGHCPYMKPYDFCSLARPRETE